MKQLRNTQKEILKKVILTEINSAADVFKLNVDNIHIYFQKNPSYKFALSPILELKDDRISEIKNQIVSFSNKIIKQVNPRMCVKMIYTLYSYKYWLEITLDKRLDEIYEYFN